MSGQAAGLLRPLPFQTFHGSDNSSNLERLNIPLTLHPSLKRKTGRVAEMVVSTNYLRFRTAFAYRVLYSTDLLTLVIVRSLQF